MNRILKAVLWAIPPMAVLVILPRVLIEYVPSSTISQASSVVGVSIPGLVNTIAIFGVILAALSFVQSWTHEWSIAKPIASTLHIVTAYALLLFLLGFGNMMTFGTASISISLSSAGAQMSGIGSPELSIVSTFLALMVGVAVVIKTGHKWMKFVEDKRFYRTGLGGAPTGQKREGDRRYATVALLAVLIFGAAFVGYFVTAQPSPVSTTSTTSSTTPVKVSSTSTGVVTGSTIFSSTTTSYSSKVMGYSGYIQESLNVTDYSSTNYKSLNMTLNVVFPMSFVVNSSGALVVLLPQNATYSGHFSEVLSNMSCVPQGSTSNSFSGSLRGSLTYVLAAQFNKTQGVVVLQVSVGREYGNGLPDNCWRGVSPTSGPDWGLGDPENLLTGQVMGPNDSTGVMSQTWHGQRIDNIPGAYYGLLLHGYQGQSLAARYSGYLTYWNCSGQQACGGGRRSVAYTTTIALNYSS